MKHLLAHPELLELPASEPVEYLTKDDRRFLPDPEPAKLPAGAEK